MRKLLTFCLCLVSGIYFIGCSLSRNVKENLIEWSKIYIITLNSYLEQDTALNKDIDFIAIDLTTLEFINDSDKKDIVEWLEMQYVSVKNINFDGLKAEGLYDEEDMYIPDGVFLKINKVVKNNNEIIIEGMKYRGALGANWFKTKWKLNNNIWEFVGTVMTMIS